MKNKKAFFLFEITLTIAILSLGLLFIIRSIGMSMRVARSSFNYSQAINFAHEKSFELELISSMSNSNSDLKREGTFVEDEDFGWKYSIEKLEDYNLSKTVLDISWKDGRREGSLDITTYVPLL